MAFRNHRPYGRWRAPIRTAAQVLARMSELEDVAVNVAPLIAQLQSDAEAIAAEHGHVLGEWYQGEGLLTAARCTACTATVCLRAAGHGSNAAPLRWLAAGDCQPVLPRYHVVKTASPVTYLVCDREQPKLGASSMHRKATAARARAEQLNGGVDEYAAALAKVTRLRTQLAKAEAALEAVTA